MLQKLTMHTKRFAVLFTALVFALVLLLPFTSQAQDKQAFIENFEQLIASNKGKVIYIDFWASWCIPCRKSFPWMNEMQQRYPTLKIITINLDSDKNNAKEFLQQYPANFDVIYDPNGFLAKKFKLKGMPNSFVINQAGSLVSAHVGFTDDKKMAYEQEIIELLKR